MFVSSGHFIAPFQQFNLISNKSTQLKIVLQLSFEILSHYYITKTRTDSVMNTEQTSKNIFMYIDSVIFGL